MGKVLIIKNADFSAVALDRINMGFEDVIITDYTNYLRHLCWITNDLTNLLPEATTAYSCLIPAKSYSRIKVTSNIGITSTFAFLTNDSIPSVGEKFSTSDNMRHQISGDGQPISIPFGTKYILLGLQYGANDYSPKSVQLLVE